MRKIILVLVILFSIVSCTTEKTDDSVLTASVKSSFQSLDNLDNIVTGKSVYRGELHAWIDSIKVTAKSKDFAYSTKENYQLVDDNAISGDFVMGNVAVGLNDFFAVTTTNTVPLYKSIIYPSSTSSTDKMNLLQALNPYAIYTASVDSFNVLLNKINVLPTMNLTTKYGRTISLFKLDERIRGNDNYVIITPIVDGVEKSPITINDSNDGSFYWSDTNTTEGKIITFNITVYNSKNTPLATLAPISITIKASTSINSVYTINIIGSLQNTVNQKFTAQKWNNEDSENQIDIIVDASDIPTNGLIAYYPFNGNASDVSGNNNSGTVNGATLTSDRFGNDKSAYGFDGVSNYIRINNVLLPNTPNSYTISLWYKSSNFSLTNGNAPTLISDRSTGLSSYKYAIGINPSYNNRLGGTIFNGSGLTGDTAYKDNIVADNNWHHVVFIYDKSVSTIYLYIDNILVNKTDNVTHWSTKSDPTNIGYLDGFVGASGFFNGNIDDIGVWNRALTQTEITNLYNSKN